MAAIDDRGPLSVVGFHLDILHHAVEHTWEYSPNCVLFFLLKFQRFFSPFCRFNRREAFLGFDRHLSNSLYPNKGWPSSGGLFLGYHEMFTSHRGVSSS